MANDSKSTSAARFIDELRAAGFSDVWHPCGQMIAVGRLRRGNQIILVEAYADGSFQHFLVGTAQTFEDALIECGAKQAEKAVA